MLRIGICDDEEYFLETISEITAQYYIGKQVEYEICTYFDGIELINSHKKFDLLFLDIEMKVLNGIETAKKIRETDMNVPIIFITGYSQYWRRAYSVHAFHYIEKPIRAEQIVQVLEDFWSMLQNEDEDKILLITDDGMVSLKYSEIYYFYIEKKKRVSVHT
ncbi:MAG: response regulator, partial [Lachnospiraceae bacterium]|nr:response regulator [Lachnospiraceae bacterium]